MILCDCIVIFQFWQKLDGRRMFWWSDNGKLKKPCSEQWKVQWNVNRMTMGIMIGIWEEDGANPFKGRQLCRRLPTPFMPCSYMQYVSLTRLPFHMQYPVIVTIHCTRRWDGGSGFHTSSHAKHGDAQANFAILWCKSCYFIKSV